MASGFGVPKPDKANHPNRLVANREMGERAAYERLHEKWKSGGRITAEEGNTRTGQQLRRDIYGYD
jgi:hypothetical protein